MGLTFQLFPDLCAPRQPKPMTVALQVPLQLQSQQCQQHSAEMQLSSLTLSVLISLLSSHLKVEKTAACRDMHFLIFPSLTAEALKIC